MAYLNSINTNSTDYAINSFANLLLASGGVTDAKTVTFPNGYDVTDGSNMTFRVLFPYGHNGQANMTLNGVDVVVNKYGTLIPLPYHNISSTYKSLQANTVLEMYYTSNYDGNNTPAFVIVGNPIVLSSNDYIIYADGKNMTDTIHPVGTIYWTGNQNFDPNVSFGGTWVQIKDRFILACGDTYKTVGATGGASTVTLSVSNMPSHTHSFSWSGSHSHNFCRKHVFPSSSSNEFFYFGGVSAGTTYEFTCYSQKLHSNGTGAYGNLVSDTFNYQLFDDTENGNVFSTVFNAKPGNELKAFDSYGLSNKDTSITVSGPTSSNGSGTAFSILPPYVVKYCWERTA